MRIFQSLLTIGFAALTLAQVQDHDATNKDELTSSKVIDEGSPIQSSVEANTPAQPKRDADLVMFPNTQVKPIESVAEIVQNQPRDTLNLNTFPDGPAGYSRPDDDPTPTNKIPRGHMNLNTLPDGPAGYKPSNGRPSSDQVPREFHNLNTFPDGPAGYKPDNDRHSTSRVRRYPQTVPLPPFATAPANETNNNSRLPLPFLPHGPAGYSVSSPSIHSSFTTQTLASTSTPSARHTSRPPFPPRAMNIRSPAKDEILNGKITKKERNRNTDLHSITNSHLHANTARNEKAQIWHPICTGSNLNAKPRTCTKGPTTTDLTGTWCQKNCKCDKNGCLVDCDAKAAPGCEEWVLGATCRMDGVKGWECGCMRERVGARVGEREIRRCKV